MFPATFPAMYGRYVLLKPLSDGDRRPVYLVAVDGSSQPSALKIVSRGVEVGFSASLSKEESKTIARMRSPHLVELLELTSVGGETGFVMAYVAGRSLEEIASRAAATSDLLSPHLALALAREILAGAASFWAFEGAARAHGNISSRTVLLSYAGDLRLAGYRPGYRSQSDSESHPARDRRSLGSVLARLPVQGAVPELHSLIRRLHDPGAVAPGPLEEASSILRGRAPTPEDRQQLSAWMERLFPGEARAKTEENDRLVAAGRALLALAGGQEGGPLEDTDLGYHADNPATVSVALSDVHEETDKLVAPQPHGRKATPSHSRSSLALAGGLVMAVVAGVVALVLIRPAKAPEAFLPLLTPGQPANLVPKNPLEDTSPTRSAAVLVAPSLVPVAPVLEELAIPRPVPAAPKEPPAEVPLGHAAEARRQASVAEELLRKAEQAFERGEQISAIQLGRQALKAGGAVRAHLALAKSYQSMHLLQEALEHYRAASELEPGNSVASAGIRVVEKQLLP